MRKVFIEVEATVLVPVRVKGTFILLADDDARIGTVLKQLAQGRRPTKADVDDIADVEIINVGDYDADELGSAVVDVLHEGRFTIHSSEVLDSK